MKREVNEIRSDVLTFHVDEESSGLSLKEILYDRMRLSSRLVRKAKRKKNIRVNGNRISFHATLRRGDLVEVTMEEEPNQFEPQDIPVEVVYEDVDLLIVNKQPGIVVHPTRRHPIGTMANAIVHYMREKGESFKIRFVNRLDRDTSGLIIIAKNPYTQQELSKQMQQNKVEKIYLSVVKGIIEENTGTINEPIGRPDEEDIRRKVYDEGQPSITHYNVINRLEEATVIKVKLETGRTHQIRVHMSYIGYPLIGDELYGYVDEDLIKRQALHAEKLIFHQPRTNERIEVIAPIPKDIKELIEKLS
ncbi:RluA family pseudouridine synthase [Crassaminicella profunda]|uniref:RluA family pseudouridine synthase n=1 Tax=Crassaminicella profunda TaxID=1286698 RepID=UPI001CA7B1F8|nr:RluA family pseudouridine synthase [Crassaminicella profunda]QZY53825.1 RluA family pseudouridine synthase [Crassaminicella profunda]